MIQKRVNRARKPRKKKTPVSGAPAAKPEKVHPVIELLDEWLKDESGYDEEAWPELKKALNEERDRVGARRLFCE